MGWFGNNRVMDFNDFLHECRSRCMNKMPFAASVLSVGAAGTWYFQWFDRCYPYKISNHTGIDLNSRPLDLPDHIIWIQHDGSDLSPVPSGSVDLVFAGQFIEHISWECQVNFLKEVHRVLKAGGLFVLDSPNFAISNRYGWKQPEHISELSYSQIRDAISLAGFHLMESYGILPVSLLGTPPEMFGSYLKTRMDLHLSRRDLKKSITRDPDNAFIWWIVTKKVIESPDWAGLSLAIEDAYTRNKVAILETIDHQIGSPVLLDGKYFIEVSQKSGVGFPLYGPYKFFDGGRYSVEFNICMADKDPSRALDDRIICSIDVVTDGGKKVILKKDLSRKDLLMAENCMLEFSIGSPTSLEFRVFSYGTEHLFVGVNRKVTKL